MQIHKLRKLVGMYPKLSGKYTPLHGNQAFYRVQNAAACLDRKYSPDNWKNIHPCMVTDGNVLQGIWNIYTPALKSDFV